MERIRVWVARTTTNRNAEERIEIGGTQKVGDPLLNADRPLVDGCRSRFYAKRALYDEQLAWN